MGQNRTIRPAATPALRRQMHATLYDDRAGRMTQGSGWCEGARNKRRLGTLSMEGGGGDSWVGFAGLSRTVVEKLVQEGGKRDEDTVAATYPHSNTLADMRHVLGGECSALDTGPLLTQIRSVERTIVKNGGGNTELREVLMEASHYLSHHTSTGRPVLPTQQGWEALRCVIGCNVPNIEWIAPGGMSDVECGAWCKEVDKAVLSGWNATFISLGPHTRRVTGSLGICARDMEGMRD